MSDLSIDIQDVSSDGPFVVVSVYLGVKGRNSIDEMIDRLVRRFQENMSKRYSECIDHFYILLRFGSRHDVFTKGHIHSLRINNKKRFASFYVDFGADEHVYSDEVDLASKVAIHLSEGAIRLAMRTGRKDQTFQNEQFASDLSKVLDQFSMHYRTKWN